MVRAMSNKHGDERGRGAFRNENLELGGGSKPMAPFGWHCYVGASDLAAERRDPAKEALPSLKTTAARRFSARADSFHPDPPQCGGFRAGAHKTPQCGRFDAAQGWLSPPSATALDLCPHLGDLAIPKIRVGQHGPLVPLVAQPGCLGFGRCGEWTYPAHVLGAIDKLLRLHVRRAVARVSL